VVPSLKAALELAPETNAMAEVVDPQALYFGGDMEAAIPLTGQVCGRIDAVRPVAEILTEIASECAETLAELHRVYGN